MVYCGLFPTEGDEFEKLREALGKLQLNDAALHYEPDVSPVQGWAAMLCIKANLIRYAPLHEIDDSAQGSHKRMMRVSPSGKRHADSTATTAG